MPSFMYLAHFDSDSNLAYTPTEKSQVATSTSRKGSRTSYQSTRPPKRQRVIDHLKRFWALHLVLWICITVLVVCLAIFVIVPVIAQRKVDDANYEIQGINILDPKPNSVLIQINSTIKTDGQVKAEVDPFQANLALADVLNAQPFMTLKFPKTNANKFQIVNISQIVEITDKNALQQFNHALFQNHTLRIKMYGKTNVKPAGMTKKYPVNVSKLIEFNGLNLLNGTKLENTSLSFDQHAPNFNATAVIINPSYYTLDMGNVTLQSFADGQPVGNVGIANLLLRPGKNIFPIESRINQTRIVQIVEKPAYCTTGNIPFKLEGRKIQNHGEDVTWLASSLSDAKMTVDISIAEMIGSLESANFCV